MNRIFIVLLASIAILVVLFALLPGRPDSRHNAETKSSGASTEPLLIFCAASNQAVMEAIKADYEQETGRQVDIQYGASQTLFSSIEVSKAGDLYLPADDSYLTIGRAKGLIDQVLPIAVQSGVIAVRKGNPGNIRTLADLSRDDVRLVQANPDAAAIGKVTRDALTKLDLWDEIADATTAYRTTVTEVCTDLLVDAADAGIVYDAVLHTYPDLECIQVPELAATASDVSVGVISGSRQPQKALHFARYISAADRGLKRYQEFGFRIKDGDPWSDTP